MLAQIRSSFLRTAVARPASARFLSTPPTATTGEGSAQAQNKVMIDVLTDVADALGNAGPSSTPDKKWRTFYSGQIVKPSDLTLKKCASARPRTQRKVVPPPAPQTRYNDMFRQLNLDPVDFALNPSVLSAYISEMGKIYGRNITGLTSRSQRRLGKAIRRARMIGVLPQLSRPSKQWVYSSYRRPKLAFSAT